MTKVQKSPDNRYVMREHNSGNELKISPFFLVDVWGHTLLSNEARKLCGSKQKYFDIFISRELNQNLRLVIEFFDKNATKMIKDKMKYIKTNIIFLPSSDANFVHFTTVNRYLCMGHIQHFNIKDDFYSDFIVGDLSLSLKDTSEFWFIHQNVCLQFTFLTKIQNHTNKKSGKEILLLSKFLVM